MDMYNKTVPKTKEQKVDKESIIMPIKSLKSLDMSKKPATKNTKEGGGEHGAPSTYFSTYLSTKLTK